MEPREPCVCILASGRNGTLYVGATSNLATHMIQHRDGRFDGFTKGYGVTRLVHHEPADTMATAIAREKQLRRWQRDWKRNLIERDNPAWNDLSIALGIGPAVAPVTEVDSETNSA